MNVVVTTFSNPFSFFCICKDDAKEIDLPHVNNSITSSKSEISDVNHGQYVAVLWKGRWSRGIVTMESQFLIWLVDYGTYLRPDKNTVYVDLPIEYKKHPTKVFEASIHGVAPLERELTEDCQIKNVISREWSQGAITKAQTLIASASLLQFVPTAILSTKNNDVVLGDLYLSSNNKTINLIDALEDWPVFLEKNQESYIQNLSLSYTTRRRHRACLLKPDFSDFNVPTIPLDISHQQYKTICDETQQLEVTQCDVESEDGATVISNYVDVEDKGLTLTASEIEQYSQMYITIGGQEHNMLHVLLNKIRDLKMCERYKDCLKKGIGRATYRHRRHIEEDDI